LYYRIVDVLTKMSGVTNTKSKGVANIETGFNKKTLDNSRSMAVNDVVCCDCTAGNMQLNEVRDDWRKKKTYYEQLRKGPGTKLCMSVVDGKRCEKMIHAEISRVGVAYVCRNGMCYKDDDAECDNWMCFDCNLEMSGGGRKRSRRGG
jgi:hypothetical protein